MVSSGNWLPSGYREECFRENTTFSAGWYDDPTSGNFLFFPPQIFCQLFSQCSTCSPVDWMLYSTCTSYVSLLGNIFWTAHGSPSWYLLFTYLIPIPAQSDWVGVCMTSSREESSVFQNMWAIACMWREQEWVNWLVLQSNMQINSNTHIQYLEFFPEERNHDVITVLIWMVVPVALHAKKKAHIWQAKREDFA